MVQQRDLTIISILAHLYLYVIGVTLEDFSLATSDTLL